MRTSDVFARPASASSSSCRFFSVLSQAKPSLIVICVVTPLVAGRVTRVSPELGAAVRRGQTLAQIYSPELAEAQTKYVSAKAMLDAHDRELQRTQKLVEVGAASRQELERIHAEHTAQIAAVRVRDLLSAARCRADAKVLYCKLAESVSH